MSAARRAVWMSKGRFDPLAPSCAWGVEGRGKDPLEVPSSGSLLIVFDQDLEPVELWEVGIVEHFPEAVFEDGWTWFAETEMSGLITSSADSGITGIDFHDQAFLLLPAAGGWEGAPVELDDRQVAEVFRELGWSTDLRHR